MDSVGPVPSSDPLERDSESFPLLLAQARSGNSDACASLFRRYGSHVLRVVRRHLSKHLRKVYDSVDLSQDVWKSFFVNILPSQDFRTSAELVRFLTGVARHKAMNLHRQQLETQKRSLLREVSESEVSAAIPDPHLGLSRPVDALDEVESLLRGLSERDRLAFLALQHGDTLEETASQLAVSVKTVRRILERCRERKSDQG